MLKEFEVVVHLQENQSNPIFSINTNDLHVIKVKVTVEKGLHRVDLSGTAVRLAVKKPDNKTIFQDGMIVDGAAGRCEFLLDPQAYRVAGEHEAEVMIYDGAGKVAVTSHFTYISKKGILDDNTVQIQNKFQESKQIVLDAPAERTKADQSANEAVLNDANVAPRSAEETNGAQTDEEEVTHHDILTFLANDYNKAITKVNGIQPENNESGTIVGLNITNIEAYGAVAGDPYEQPSEEVMTANLNAFKQALVEKKNIMISPKFYWINGTIPVTGGQYLIGSGSASTVLKLPGGANYPAVEMSNCDGAKVKGFKIEYNDWNPYDYPNRNAVFFRKTVRNSEIADIDVHSVYRGFALNNTNSAVHNIFSCNFRNLKGFWFAKNFMCFSPFIGGNTGCVFDNIYCHNGQRDNRLGDEHQIIPYVFKKFTESVMLQINAEWCNVVSAFFFESNRNVSLTSVHLEGLDSISANNGLIQVVDGRVNMDTVDFYNNIFRSGGKAGLFRVNVGGQLKVDGMTETLTIAKNGTTVRGIISDLAADDRIEMEGVRQFSGLNMNFMPDVNTNPSNEKPKLIKFNDIVYYQELVSPNGTKWKANISNTGVVTYTRVP